MSKETLIKQLLSKSQELEKLLKIKDCDFTPQLANHLDEIFQECAVLLSKIEPNEGVDLFNLYYLDTSPKNLVKYIKKEYKK